MKISDLYKHALLLSISLPFVVVSELYAQLELPAIDHMYIEGVSTYSRPRSTLRDKHGLLWYGSEASGSGLYVYDGISLAQIGQSRLDTNSLSDVNVVALYEQSDGRIWAGTRSNGLCIYVPWEDRFLRYSQENSQLPSNTVSCIYPEGDTLFLGTDNGLVICRPDDLSFEQLWNNCASEDSELADHVNKIHHIVADDQDSNVLWLLTLGGLVSFHKETQHFDHYKMPFIPNQEVELPNPQYLLMWGHIVDRVLWISSWGGGILRFDTRTEQWSQFRPGEPTQWDIFYQMMPKSESEFWVCSYWGFGVFDTEEHAFAFYDSLPGRITHRLGGWNATAMYIENDYELVVLGESGASVVHVLDKTPQRGRLYPPLVRSVSIDGRKLPTFNLLYPEQDVVLGAEEVSLSFNYSSASLGVDSLYYRHRLSGHDSDWNMLQGVGHVDYTNITEGIHTFEFQVSADGESWMDGAQWSVQKIVPFWQQKQAMWILAIAMFVIIAVVVYLRVQQRRKEHRLELKFQKSLAESQMAALRAQINPHFIFNSLNSIKSYILQKETATANTYLTKFSHLMRKMLSNSATRLISISDELDALKLYIEIESMRFENKFTYAIACDESLDQDALFLPPMLIQPFVENAIWHGLMHLDHLGDLKIIVSQQDTEHIKIEVIDSGIGRVAAAQQSKGSGVLTKSYGTKITSDRIKLVNQSMNIQTSVEIHDLYEGAKAIGTRVVIVLPFITLAMKEQLDNKIEKI